MPFVKGVSSDPTGRPRESAEIKALARERSPEAFECIVTLMKDADPRVRLAAAQAVLNRAWGKLAQATELTASVSSTTMTHEEALAELRPSASTLSCGIPGKREP